MIEDACRIYIMKERKHSPNPEVNEVIEEITEVKQMCRTNMGGFVELEFLPYSGGFYEQPAPLLERILTIIGYLNKYIDEKDDD